MSRRAPFSGLTFSLVGPGRVGASLATWAVARGAEAIALGVRAESDAAREIAGRLDCVTVPLSRLKTGGQDLLWIAVPDPELPEVARTLGRRPQAHVVLHTSGRYDATVLAPIGRSGSPAARSALGSFHPLRAFPEPALDPAVAQDVVFGTDGDPEALELALRLAQGLGATTVEIPPRRRLLYHFAATLAAGGVVTLMAAAAEIAQRAGLPREVLAGYFELARGALEQAERSDDPAVGVTGPVARGDRETVVSELEALEREVPEMLPAILALTRESLRQRVRIGASSPAAERLIEELEQRFAGDPADRPADGHTGRESTDLDRVPSTTRSS